MAIQLPGGGVIDDSLVNKLANPMNSSCWNTLWTESHSSLCYRLLYDNIRNKYYIVEHSGMTISIYSLNGTTKTLLASKTFADDEFNGFHQLDMNYYNNSIYDYTIIPGLNKIAILMHFSCETSWYDEEISESVYEYYTFNIICMYDIALNTFSDLVGKDLVGIEYPVPNDNEYASDYYFIDPTGSVQATMRKTDGHSCFGIGNYLAAIVSGGTIVNLIVLDCANNFNIVGCCALDYELYYEYNDDEGGYVATEDRTPFDINTSYAYSNNYLGLVCTYPLYDYINMNYENDLSTVQQGGGHSLDILTISATSGTIRQKQIRTSDTETGYQAGYGTYTRDDIQYGRIACIDFENNKFGVSYFYGYNKSSSYYDHIYGIVDPTSTSIIDGIFTKKTSFKHTSYNKYNRFQIACINNEFYGMWLGSDAKIIKLNSEETPDLDNTLSGYISLGNIANYKTNSGDFIPYNGSSIILDGGSVYYYGFSPSLPTVNKDGVNGFIKIKN